MTPFFEGLVATLLAKLRSVDALTEEEYAAALAEPLDLRVGLPADAAPTEPVAVQATRGASIRLESLPAPLWQ